VIIGVLLVWVTMNLTLLVKFHTVSSVTVGVFVLVTMPVILFEE
jgi:hypothetical protein